MPTRIVREGIITSEKVNSLSAKAELFYRRLMSVADDYGRFWANPILLRASCYPIQLDKVSEADVKQMLNECIAVDLLAIYGSGKYLLLKNFGQQTRSKSKFPEPTENELLSKCKSPDNQMCSLDGVGVGVGVGGECARASTPDAHIPTLQEVETLASMRAIPRDFAKHFFDYHQDKNLWLNKHNRLIAWESMILNWWTRDRASWVQGANGKPVASNPRNAGMRLPSDNAKRIAEAARRSGL